MNTRGRSQLHVMDYLWEQQCSHISVSATKAIREYIESLASYTTWHRVKT